MNERRQEWVLIVDLLFKHLSTETTPSSLLITISIINGGEGPWSSIQRRSTRCNAYFRQGILKLSHLSSIPVSSLLSNIHICSPFLFHPHLSVLSPIVLCPFFFSVLLRHPLFSFVLLSSPRHGILSSLLNNTSLMLCMQSFTALLGQGLPLSDHIK